MKLDLYYGQIRAWKARLADQFPTGFCFIKGSESGRVCEVSTDNAARCIVDATHRLATPEEVTAFKTEAEQQRQSNLATELLRAKTYRIVLDTFPTGK